MTAFHLPGDWGERPDLVSPSACGTCRDGAREVVWRIKWVHGAPAAGCELWCPNCTPQLGRAVQDVGQNALFAICRLSGTTVSWLRAEWTIDRSIVRLVEKALIELEDARERASGEARFLAACARDCRCSGPVVCGGVTAGGFCDDIQDDDE